MKEAKAISNLGSDLYYLYYADRHSGCYATVELVEDGIERSEPFFNLHLDILFSSA